MPKTKDKKPEKALTKPEAKKKVVKPKANKGMKVGGRKKHNWISLKKDYLYSKHHFIRDFLIEKGIAREGKPTSGVACKKTKGWRDDKLAMLEEQHDEIRQTMRDQLKPYVKELILDFKEAKTMTINAIQERLANHAGKGPFGYFLKIADLRDILMIIKTELGEPTSISKSSSFNANVDLNKLIDQAEKAEKPIDPYDNDREVYGDPTDLPTLTIDGHEQ